MINKTIESVEQNYLKKENVPQFQIGDTSQIAHIDAEIHIRPYDLATIQDLITSGDLDPGIVAKLSTLDIKGTQRTWDKATAGTGPATGTGCSPH